MNDQIKDFYEIPEYYRRWCLESYEYLYGKKVNPNIDKIFQEWALIDYHTVADIREFWKMQTGRTPCQPST